MTKKRLLKADLEELCLAFENSFYEQSYFLDLQTGEILILSEGVSEEEREKTQAAMVADPDRYVETPQAQSRDGYRDMADFVATLEDVSLAGALRNALDGKGPFRRFKDILLYHPEEREEWFKFEHGRILGRVIDWLSSIDVDPALD